jgi:hypothetical protein
LRNGIEESGTSAEAATKNGIGAEKKAGTSLNGEAFPYPR